MKFRGQGLNKRGRAAKLGGRRCIAVLVVAAAVLAVPGSALAHPSVYTDTAKVPQCSDRIDNDGDGKIDFGTGASNDPGCSSASDTDEQTPDVITDLATQTRYVVSNHGNSLVYRETNLLTDRGVIDYKRVPSPYRNGITTADLISQAASGVQPHNVCRTPVLETESAITDWQEHTAPDATPPNKPEPFYGYVPFQKASAGLDDHPDDWIPHVKTLTSGNVDLALVSDDPVFARAQLSAMCEGLLRGVFVPADEVQTAATAFNSSTILNATTPLNAQIAAFQAAAATDAQVKSASAAENQALKADVARLKAIALSIDPVGTPTVGQLVGGGVSAKVTGPAGKPVSVRVLAGTAKSLRLKSRGLAKASAKVGADGTVTVKLTATGKAKAALKKTKKAVKVAFEVVAGDRSASTTRNLAR
jgi:hypothetical protein